MLNVSDSARSQANRTMPSAAKKLMQAAALASVLIPLGSVPVEGASISCVTTEGNTPINGDSFCEAFGVYDEVTNTNTWKFYETAVFNEDTQKWEFDPDDLLYNFEITGTPNGSFSLDVLDDHVAADDSEEYTLPEGVECIPIYDTNTCVIFNVLTVDRTAAWFGDYTILMRWFADEQEGPTPMRPPDDGNNHIYRAESGYFFDDQLLASLYDPNPDPIDPALSGKGSSFSAFIAGRDVANVPEPSMLLLIGTGVVAGLYRRRRQG